MELAEWATQCRVKDMVKVWSIIFKMRTTEGSIDRFRNDLQKVREQMASVMMQLERTTLEFHEMQDLLEPTNKQTGDVSSGSNPAYDVKLISLTVSGKSGDVSKVTVMLDEVVKRTARWRTASTVLLSKSLTYQFHGWERK